MPVDVAHGGYILEVYGGLSGDLRASSAGSPSGSSLAYFQASGRRHTHLVPSYDLDDRVSRFRVVVEAAQRAGLVTR